MQKNLKYGFNRLLPYSVGYLLLDFTWRNIWRDVGLPHRRRCLWRMIIVNPHQIKPTEVFQKKSWWWRWPTFWMIESTVDNHVIDDAWISWKSILLSSIGDRRYTFDIGVASRNIDSWNCNARNSNVFGDTIENLHRLCWWLHKTVSCYCSFCTDLDYSANLESETRPCARYESWWGPRTMA